MDWQISRNSNFYVKTEDATLTVFRSKDRQGRYGWKGLIVFSAAEGPVFGELLHSTPEEAQASVVARYAMMQARRQKERG